MSLGGEEVSEGGNSKSERGSCAELFPRGRIEVPFAGSFPSPSGRSNRQLYCISNCSGFVKGVGLFSTLTAVMFMAAIATTTKLYVLCLYTCASLFRLFRGSKSFGFVSLQWVQASRKRSAGIPCAAKRESRER